MGGILATALGLLGQSPVQTTYSFKDLTGVIVNPVLAATIPLGFPGGILYLPHSP